MTIAELNTVTEAMAILNRWGWNGTMPQDKASDAVIAIADCLDRLAAERDPRIDREVRAGVMLMKALDCALTGRPQPNCPNFPDVPDLDLSEQTPTGVITD